MRTRLGDFITTVKGSPAIDATTSQSHHLELSRRRFDSDRDIACGQRLTVGFHHVGSQCQRLTKHRLVRRKIETHRLTLCHVSLISHPSNDLAPKSIVVFVFNTSPPTPCSIGAHKQYFTCAKSLRHQQRDSPKFVAHILVHAENLASGLGPNHRCIPLEARQRIPSI